MEPLDWNTTVARIYREAVADSGVDGVDRQDAYDIAAGCGGFGYALGVAADTVRAGSARYVLVVGVEKLSEITDLTERVHSQRLTPHTVDGR